MLEPALTLDPEYVRDVLANETDIDDLTDEALSEIASCCCENIVDGAAFIEVVVDQLRAEYQNYREWEAWRDGQDSVPAPLGELGER